MGQKINPKIFRLGLKTNEWDSYYIEKNYEESTLLIYSDIKIRDFISRIFVLNGLILHSCKLRYTVEELYISVYYFRLPNNSFDLETIGLTKITKSLYFFLNNYKTNHGFKIFIKIRDIKKYSKKLVPLRLDSINKIFRRYLKNNLFEEILQVSLVSMLINNSSRFFVDFLSLRLKSIKSQTKVLIYLKLILSELIKKDVFKVMGLKIIINGRFNKSQRSRKKDILLGSVSLQTLKLKIDYCHSTVFTSVGTFGIKLWICRKLD